MSLLSLDQKSVHAAATATRIKVMYIISDLSIGGAEMTLYKLLANTNRERFEPVVVSLIDQGVLRERVEALGIAVYTTRMKAGRPTPLGFWRLLKLVNRIQPDLIFGWMYHSCLAAVLAKMFSRHRTTVLWSIHDSALGTEKKLTAAVIKLCRLLSGVPAKTIFVSHASQAQHQRRGYRVESGCVIPNGIDVEEFKPSAQARLSVRAELGIPNDAVLIGLSGRYHPIKDHANFLKAAARISQTHPETHFLLVGRNVDRHNPELSGSIRELGLAARTHLLGERHDTSRLAASLDIFSISSWGESCPNVIGEAMACGVPCVVTDVGDVGWMVGQTGRVVPVCDSKALAAAWTEMIELGPQNRAALGLLARSRVVDTFPIGLIMAQYEHLYETALATRTREPLARIGSLTPALEEKSAL